MLKQKTLLILSNIRELDRVSTMKWYILYTTSNDLYILTYPKAIVNSSSIFYNSLLYHVMLL